MVADLGLVFPCLYELYGVEMVRITVLKWGVGSVERAQVRDQPELFFTITESLSVREFPAIAR